MSKKKKAKNLNQNFLNSIWIFFFWGNSCCILRWFYPTLSQTSPCQTIFSLAIEIIFAHHLLLINPSTNGIRTRSFGSCDPLLQIRGKRGLREVVRKAGFALVAQGLSLTGQRMCAQYFFFCCAQKKPKRNMCLFPLSAM